MSDNKYIIRVTSGYMHTNNKKHFSFIAKSQRVLNKYVHMHMPINALRFDTKSEAVFCKGILEDSNRSYTIGDYRLDVILVNDLGVEVCSNMKQE